MKDELRKTGMLVVHYDTSDDRQRILRILERSGFRIPRTVRAAVVTRFYPHRTCLICADLIRKSVADSPQPFICAAMVSSGVRLYTVSELERMAELGFECLPRYPVFHVPHDGNVFPEDLMADVIIPAGDFMAYHEAMRDRHVRELIPRPYVGQMLKTFEVSRLLCDVERLIGPGEIMERVGMGFCYEKAYDGTVIKRVTERTRAAARVYYDRHHREIDALCERHPRMLFFDMHSYTDAIVPAFARVPGRPTPDLCVGTDPRFTPPRLTEIVLRRFREAGFRTAVNEPYGGVYVPESVMDGSGGCDFAGIMLEFDRRVYCDGSGEPVREQVEKIRRVIRAVMADCVDLE